MSTIEREIDYKGMSIKIYYDSDADSPASWGNEDYFLCADYRHLYLKDTPLSADECRNAMLDNKAFLKGYYIFPVSIYDHSGIALSLGTSHGWDYSNYCAFLCVKRMKGWSWAKRQAEKRASNLVDTWNEYLSGEVYGFVSEDEDGEQIDSCWGFYGEDGIKEAIAEAKDVIDYEIEKRAKAEREAFIASLANHIAKRKAQIKSHAPFYARTAFAF